MLPREQIEELLATMNRGADAAAVALASLQASDVDTLTLERRCDGRWQSWASWDCAEHGPFTGADIAAAIDAALEAHGDEQ